MATRTVIWGLGNHLRGDDAAGLVLAERLKERNIPDTNVFVCETVPENYITPLRESGAGKLIIIDAIDMKLPPGNTRTMGLKDVVSVSFSSHGLPLDLLLKPFEKELEIIVIAIQPGDTSPGVFLSPPVEAALAELDFDSIEHLEKAAAPYRQNRSPR
ncbi:MAG: hydrogenase maturation protease [Synergistota bacterium]|nr:hydrogenase maturation protease [Synergistota bacterium]